METIIRTKYQHRFGPIVVILKDGEFFICIKKGDGKFWRVQGFGASSNPEEALRKLDDYQGGLFWVKPVERSEADKIVILTRAQALAYRVNACEMVFDGAFALPAWRRKPGHPGAVKIDDETRNRIKAALHIGWYVPPLYFMEMAKNELDTRKGKNNYRSIDQRQGR